MHQIDFILRFSEFLQTANILWSVKHVYIVSNQEKAQIDGVKSEPLVHVNLVFIQC